MMNKFQNIGLHTVRIWPCITISSNCKTSRPFILQLQYGADLTTGTNGARERERERQREKEMHNATEIHT